MLLHSTVFCQEREVMDLKWSFRRYFLIFIILFGIGIFLGFVEKEGWLYQLNASMVKGASSTRIATLTPYFLKVAKYADTVYDIAVGLIIVVILALFKKWKEPLTLFLSLMFAGLSIEIMKNLYRIQRPAFSQLVPTSSYAYPSGHSVGAFALYGLLIYLIVKSRLPKTVSWILTVVLSFLIASILYSRLYLGVHWGIDVIGGGIIGLACMSLAIGITTKIHPKPYEKKELGENK